MLTLSTRPQRQQQAITPHGEAELTAMTGGKQAG
jgi:hypothetical protein